MGDFKSVYFDASVIVRRIFGQPGALADFEFRSGISSELVVVEVRRSIDNRQLLEPMDTDYLLDVRELQMRTYQRSNLCHWIRSF